MTTAKSPPFAALPEPRTMGMEVRVVEDLNPTMRRIVLASAHLNSFRYLPGQDLMLRFTDHGRVVNRRYSIRRVRSSDNFC